VRLRRELHGRAGGLSIRVVSEAPRTTIADPTIADPARTPSAGDAEEPVSALFEVLPHVLRTLRREPALVITLTYLLVAMAGIFYDYAFYRQFGIPALSLSQISDFLAAGIQEPIAIVLVLSTFPLCWLFDRINLWGRRRRAAEGARLRAVPSLDWWQRRRLGFIVAMNERRGYMRLVYVLVVVAYAWSFVSSYAGHRAEAVKRGDALEVRIRLTDGSQLLTRSDGHPPWLYLGAISQYVFVYDREAARAEIVPVNALSWIEPVPTAAPKPGWVVAPIP
jgi:hypothetical protein